MHNKQTTIGHILAALTVFCMGNDIHFDKDSAARFYTS